MAYEVKSDLQDTVDWGRKWLVDFSDMEKLNWSCLTGFNNSGAIDVKMDGSVLEENLYFKMLGLMFSSKLY